MIAAKQIFDNYENLPKKGKQELNKLNLSIYQRIMLKIYN